MWKRIVIVLFILFLLLILAWENKIIQLSWITVDMGWCQKYDSGLKIFDKVIFTIPKKGFDMCV